MLLIDQSVRSPRISLDKPTPPEELVTPRIILRCCEYESELGYWLLLPQCAPNQLALRVQNFAQQNAKFFWVWGDYLIPNNAVPLAQSRVTAYEKPIHPIKISHSEFTCNDCNPSSSDKRDNEGPLLSTQSQLIHSPLHRSWTEKYTHNGVCFKA